jgi:hypothetical protein
LAGSARQATAWLLVEQSGPWGRNALIDSHLLADVGQSILTLTEGTGTEPLLIRRPGRHADAHVSGARTVIVASVAPGRRWIRRWSLAGDAALAAWLESFDAAAVARGEPPVGGEVCTHPMLALCTHARRDLCCALAGRALLDELLASPPDLPQGWLWECSHLGGHRFAPTALVLPTGLVLGRTTAEGCRDAIAGRIPVDQSRGFSWLSPEEQVADLAVRTILGEDVRELSSTVEPVDPSGQTWRVEVAHLGRWLVTVEPVEISPRPASCGKVDESTAPLIARSVVPAS